jgi:predicted nucleic acid-binding protein
MPTTHPTRPVGALDACVLIPAGLRDLLLSCAGESVFRPVWQDEILTEVRRNSIRLLTERSGLTTEEATAAVARTLDQMARAFPDAVLPSELWVPLVPDLTCDQKDRHVLAAAIGSQATHLVTENVRDFPAASCPAGLAVVGPDQFLLDRLAAVPAMIRDAVQGMSNRMKEPRRTPTDLAASMAKGQHVPRFGEKLRELFFS